MEEQKFTKSLYKYEVCALLNQSRTTLDYYINRRYFKEMQAIGYRKNQKHLNPKQLNFLRDKIGLSE